MARKKKAPSRPKRYREYPPDGRPALIVKALPLKASVCLNEHGHLEAPPDGLIVGHAPFLVVPDTSEIVERVERADNWRPEVGGYPRYDTEIEAKDAGDRFLEARIRREPVGGPEDGVRDVPEDGEPAGQPAAAQEAQAG